MTNPDKYNLWDKFHTTEEIADIFMVSPRTVRDWAAKGIVPHYVFSGEYRFLPSELAAFFEENEDSLL